MPHLSSALGYGLEYTYSIMERARLACLKGDPLLSQPMLSIPGAETWKTREATLPEADMPSWGALKERGIGAAFRELPVDEIEVKRQLERFHAFFHRPPFEALLLE